MALDGAAVDTAFRCDDGVRAAMASNLKKRAAPSNAAVKRAA
jgi:hypothetical protein